MIIQSYKGTGFAPEAGSCGPSCSPARRPRPSLACATPAVRASGACCSSCGPPGGSRMAPTIGRRRMSVWPVLLTGPSLVSLPVDLCRGTRASHAVRLRSLSNVSGSGANAVTVTAATAPIRGGKRRPRGRTSVFDAISGPFASRATGSVSRAMHWTRPPPSGGPGEAGDTTGRLSTTKANHPEGRWSGLATGHGPGSGVALPAAPLGRRRFPGCDCPRRRQRHASRRASSRRGPKQRADRPQVDRHGPRNAWPFGGCL